VKTIHFPQFRIQSLMLLIGVIACALALVQWAGLLSVLLAAFPLSLVVEYVFRAKPPSPHARPSFSGTAATFVALLLGAYLSVCAARYACSTGMPTILSPLPLLVVAPLFVADGLQYADPWRFAASIPFSTFFLMNFYQFRVAGPAPVRMRFSFLLGVATAFSVLYFVMGWQYGIRYQGASHTLATAVINRFFLLALWGWWLAIRQKASKPNALAFATLLHCWLFWFAFPYLGELP
jgi:hypothetical protein